MGLGSLKTALVMLDFGLPVVLSHSIICLSRPSSPSSFPRTVPFGVFMHQPTTNHHVWVNETRRNWSIHLSGLRWLPASRCTSWNKRLEPFQRLQNRTKPSWTFQSGKTATNYLRPSIKQLKWSEWGESKALGDPKFGLIDGFNHRGNRNENTHKAEPANELLAAFSLITSTELILIVL